MAARGFSSSHVRHTLILSVGERGVGGYIGVPNFPVKFQKWRCLELQSFSVIYSRVVIFSEPLSNITRPDILCQIQESIVVKIL